MAAAVHNARSASPPRDSTWSKNAVLSEKSASASPEVLARSREIAETVSAVALKAVTAEHLAAGTEGEAAAAALGAVAAALKAAADATLAQSRARVQGGSTPEGRKVGLGAHGLGPSAHDDPGVLGLGNASVAGQEQAAEAEKGRSSPPSYPPDWLEQMEAARGGRHGAGAMAGDRDKESANPPTLYLSTQSSSCDAPPAPHEATAAMSLVLAAPDGVAIAHNLSPSPPCAGPVVAAVSGVAGHAVEVVGVDGLQDVSVLQPVDAATADTQMATPGPPAAPRVLSPLDNLKKALVDLKSVPAGAQTPVAGLGPNAPVPPSGQDVDEATPRCARGGRGMRIRALCVHYCLPLCIPQMWRMSKPCTDAHLCFPPMCAQSITRNLRLPPLHLLPLSSAQPH